MLSTLSKEEGADGFMQLLLNASVPVMEGNGWVGVLGGGDKAVQCRGHAF